MDYFVRCICGILKRIEVGMGWGGLFKFIVMIFCLLVFVLLC